MEIVIKKATLENLKDIINFNQQLFDYDYGNFDKTLDCSWPSNNEDYYRDSITKEDSLALVVFADNKIVGYLIGNLTKPEDYRKIGKLAEIDNMFILSEVRGQGVGTSLCERFFKWAKEKGAKRIKVVASAQNKKAIKCYRKNGFEDYNLTLERDI